MNRTTIRGGFTLVELLVILAIAGVLSALVLLSSTSTRCGSRQLKDSTQVRGLHQGFVSWAQNNNDQFPLPSTLDVNNTTVADMGTAKDHTANIFSPLVFNGTISVELLISPAEASGKIRLYDAYEFENPRTAVIPAKALWDPGLRADFTSADGGHISYAHMIPSGARMPNWTNSSTTANAGAAIMGNRGPQIASVTQRSRGTVDTKLANPESCTLLIHGSRNKWEGNIVFNDNHVEFVTSLKAGTYTDTRGVQRDDILFFNEPDDPKGTNNFLGVFNKAGPVPSAFQSIWD